MSVKEQRRRLIETHWVSNGQVGDKERWRKKENYGFVQLREWHTLSDALDAEQHLQQWAKGMFRNKREHEEAD